jgi:uncharacterized membrane protein YphA (DoxX/SURF4 family)
VTAWLGLLARLVLGALWLAAGGGKVGDLAASVRAVHAYEILPYQASKVVGVALPFVEVALALLLLAGFAVRVAAAVSAGLLAVFVAGIGSVWARGLSIDCGCFGGGGQLAAGESPQYLWEIVRDLGLLLVAGYLVLRPRSRFAVDNLLAVDPALEDEDEADGEEARDDTPLTPGDAPAR